MRLNKREIGIIDNTNFLLFVLFSLTNLEIDTGIPKVQRVIKRLNVGRINIYNPIPCSVMLLVKTILIIIPKTLVIIPPNIRIKVDLTNLLFIESPT
jgi:hypothetical protein